MYETYIILNRDPPSPKKGGQLEHGKWKTNHIHWKLGLRRGWTIRGTAMDCTGRDAGNVWCFQLWESWLVHLLGFGLRWQPSGYCLYILQVLTKSLCSPNLTKYKKGETTTECVMYCFLFRYFLEEGAMELSLAAWEGSSLGVVAPVSSWCSGSGAKK